MKLVLHLGDLSGQTLPWEVARLWGDRVVSEFQLQGALERRCGVPLTPFMQGLETAEARARLQHGFCK